MPKKSKSLHLKHKKNRFDVYFHSSKDMSELNDESVKLIITSPPYFNLKDYKKKPQKQKGQLPHSPKEYHQTYEEYLIEMEEIFRECIRVLRSDGVLFLNTDVIKYKTNDKSIIPLPFDLMNIIIKNGLSCKDIMVYKKLTGVPFQFGKKLKNRHEYLMVFSKSNDYDWNIDDIREPYEEGYIYPEGHKRRNKIGKAPSSVWEFFPPPQTGSTHYHYCPFPDDLVDRAIKLYSSENDLVLDPFLGSGVVLSRSKHLKRNGVGYEIEYDNHDLIIKSIENNKAEDDQHQLF